MRCPAQFAPMVKRERKWLTDRLGWEPVNGVQYSDSALCLQLDDLYSQVRVVERGGIDVASLKALLLEFDEFAMGKTLAESQTRLNEIRPSIFSEIASVLERMDMQCGVTGAVLNDMAKSVLGVKPSVAKEAPVTVRQPRSSEIDMAAFA
jgi:hypothetical protein